VIGKREWLKLAGATAFSILLFTEASISSGFFPKKKPPCTIHQWQHVNRKGAKSRFFLCFSGGPTKVVPLLQDGYCKTSREI
jgi:hypothetical protein